MPLLALLLILAAVAAWPRAGYATQDWAPPGEDGEKEWTACKAAPTAECLYDGLIVIAKRETDEFERGEILLSIAQASAEEGEFEKALALAGTFNDEGGLRSAAFAAITWAMADAGRLKEATTLARTISDPLHRDEAYLKIITYWSEQGISDGALELVREIEDSEIRERAVGMTAVGFAKAGDDGKAAALVAKLVNDGARARAMAALAIHYEKAGRTDLAAKMVVNATETVRTIKDSSEAVSVKVDIVKMYAKAGVLFPDAVKEYGGRGHGVADLATGMVAVGMAKAEIARAGNMHEYENSEVIEAAIHYLADRGRYEEALDLARRLNEIYAPTAYADIASAHAAAGMYDEAILVSRNIENKYIRAQSMTEIAGILLKAGRNAVAESLLAEAIKAAREFEYEWARGFAFIEAAVVLSDMDRKKEALTLARDAMHIHETGDRDMEVEWTTRIRDMQPQDFEKSVADLLH